MRLYLYTVDLRGRLFLSDTLRRTDASALRDARFLDVFFRRLRRSTRDEAALAGEPDSLAYKWASPCMGEVNLVRAEETPIVFRDVVPVVHVQAHPGADAGGGADAGAGADHAGADAERGLRRRRGTVVVAATATTAVQTTTDKANEEDKDDPLVAWREARTPLGLVFAGTLLQAFDPAKLAVGDDGKVFHACDVLGGEPCLLHTHLAQRLGRWISERDDAGPTLPAVPTVRWGAKEIPLRRLRPSSTQ